MSLHAQKIVCGLVRGAAVATFILFVDTWFFAADAAEVKNGGTIAINDTHTHIIRGYRRRGPSPTGAQALRAMDNYRIAMAILLPPPFPPNHPGIYGLPEIEPIARANPDRFKFAAGGESLNPMLQRTAPDKVTPEVIRQFQGEAEAILNAGAVGFGEIAAEHFSSGRGNHPYESAPPDHPLLLALADIAAQHGMPIDVHMEAIPEDMTFPRRGGLQNPATLKENISGFERLLEHNVNAHIVWAHAGWDLSGRRTVPLMRSLLMRHPNLYMSLKLGESGFRLTSPLNVEGKIKPGWLMMLRYFPGRFVIGSDEFFDEGPERLALARKFVDALPPELARGVASENARRIYRLEAR